MTVWPSGLRRWLQAPVRKGVGSNPTAVNASRLSVCSAGATHCHDLKSKHQAPSPTTQAPCPQAPIAGPPCTRAARYLPICSSRADRCRASANLNLAISTERGESTAQAPLHMREHDSATIWCLLQAFLLRLQPQVSKTQGFFDVFRFEICGFLVWTRQQE